MAHSDDLFDWFDRLIDETGTAVVVDEKRRRAVADLCRLRPRREVEPARAVKLGFLGVGVDGHPVQVRDVVLALQVVKVVQEDETLAVKQPRLPIKGMERTYNCS